MVAVEGGHYHIVALGRVCHAWDVLDAGVGQGDVFDLAQVDVVGVERHARVGLAGHGVLVCERAGIEVVAGVGVAGTAVQSQAVCGHVALVVAQVAEGGGVGRPAHGAGGGKLLLVYPVGHAVDDAAGCAVGGHGHLGLEVELLDVDIAAGDKGHHAVVGREYGRLLARMLGRERLEYARVAVVDVVHGIRRAAVYGARVGPYHHLCAAGAYGKALDGVELELAGAVKRQQRLHSLAGAYVVALDGAVVVGEHGVAHAVGQIGKSGRGGGFVGGEYVWLDGLDVGVAGPGRRHGGAQGGGEYEYLMQCHVRIAKVGRDVREGWRACGADGIRSRSRLPRGASTVSRPGVSW